MSTGVWRWNVFCVLLLPASKTRVGNSFYSECVGCHRHWLVRLDCQWRYSRGGGKCPLPNFELSDFFPVRKFTLTMRNLGLKTPWVWKFRVKIEILSAIRKFAVSIGKFNTWPAYFLNPWDRWRLTATDIAVLRDANGFMRLSSLAALWILPVRLSVR